MKEAILWLVVTVPIFYSDHLQDDAVASLCIVAITLGIYLLIRDRVKIIDSWPSRLLAIIGVISIALLPFSLIFSHSIPGIIWWIALAGIFIYSRLVINNEGSLNRLSMAMVFGAFIYAIHSSYYYVINGLSSYPRLESLLSLHNVYGGFLIIPIMIAIALTLTAANKKRTAFWTIVSAFLLSNFILTFSRGSWLSLAVSVIMVFLISYKWKRPSTARKVSLNGFLLTALIVILSWAMAFSLWTAAKQVSIANQTTATQNSINQAAASSTSTQAIRGSNIDATPTFAVFSGEDADNNALTARLSYFKDAWNIFIHRPLTGFGPNDYADALAHYKTDPSFYASEPHNFFLRLMVEQGIIVAILFIAFLIIALWSILKNMLNLDNEASMLKSAIFTALIASIIHASMDVDWSHQALIAIFFVFLGALYGMRKTSKKEEHRLSDRSSYIILIILIMASIASVWLFFAETARLDGDFYRNVWQIDESLASYDTAIARNPYDPDSWYGRSLTHMLSLQYDLSKEDILHAISLYPEKSQYYRALAELDMRSGNMANYEHDISESLRFHPAGDLSDQTILAGIYVTQEKYAAAKKLIDEALPTYERYQKTSWFKQNSASQAISNNIKSIEEIRSFVEKHETDKIR